MAMSKSWGTGMCGWANVIQTRFSCKSWTSTKGLLQILVAIEEAKRPPKQKPVNTR